ncbi:MAG: hypothetical protein Kow0031_07450 [Anaerolineae bacterium]
MLLFALAFVPRLLNLGQFLTADEFLWIDRSRNFLAALVTPGYQCTTPVEAWAVAEGLACTLRTGHPGVTTMWTGSFGLWLVWLATGTSTPLPEYLRTLRVNPVDPVLIAPARVATVIITSLWVVALYWLVRRLLGPKTALLGALLLALSPFHVALSRVIHHDALSTTFMTLSALAALIYWSQAERRGWLAASGVLAGLGFVSKSPAMYLMPFIALTGIWFTAAEARRSDGPFLRPFLRRLFTVTLPDGLLWFALAALTAVAVWPALWVIPRETLETVFFIGSKYATGGHAKGNFFLGEISQDPGALFYPVTWLFRTTPLVVLGLAAALLGGIARLFRRNSTPPGEALPESAALFRYLPLMLLFLAGYYLLMTVGEKKQDRYFLPAYPWLDIIAAGGLVLLVDAVAGRLKAGNRRLRSAVGAGAMALLVLLLNGGLTAWHYPYYFTYFNPLLGGIKTAEKAVTVGWGEGLDVAAVYLNGLINPNQTSVSSWYQSTFAPFYYGPAISYSKEKGKALAGDYVIFYINQVQRRFPDDVMFDFFTSRFNPVQVIQLHGVDYVWIYPSLGIDHYLDDQTYTGIASLLAWQWASGPGTRFLPGESVPFELYWEYLGKNPEEPFFVRLVDAQGRIWAEGTSRLLTGGNPPPEQWREGEILQETGQLPLPFGLPPGNYQVQLGFYTSAPAVTEGELLFAVPPDEATVTVESGSVARLSLPPDVAPVAEALDGYITLLGISLPGQPLAAGDAVPVELYWRVDEPLRADADLHVGLMSPEGEAAQAWFNLSLAETFEPALTFWQPGDLIRTRWQLELQPDLSPGRYRLELVQPGNSEATLSAGEITVAE